MRWKVRGRKRPWPDLLSDPGIGLEGLRETTMRLEISVDTVCPSRDFNPEPSEFVVGVLTSRPQRNTWPASHSVCIMQACWKGLEANRE
jgi:hypothetical protein